MNAQEHTQENLYHLIVPFFDIISKKIVMKLNITLSILLLGSLLFSLSFFAHKIYINGLKYEAIVIKIAQDHSIEKTLQDNTQQLISNVLNLFGVLKQTKPNYIDQNESLKKLYYQNGLAALYIFSAIIAFSLLSFFLVSKSFFIIYIHLSSLIALVYGLISPIFLIFIHKNFGSGDIVLQFESNTIISSIQKLFEQDNYLVGGIILFFSIIFPLAKTILLILFNVLKNNKTLSKLNHILASLGKWSMSDVFVLSIFLVYLSPSKNSVVEAELEFGFYLFFSYVVLSIFASTIYYFNDKTNRA
jgi:paraquat-inducible protein A